MQIDGATTAHWYEDWDVGQWQYTANPGTNIYNAALYPVGAGTADVCERAGIWNNASYTWEYTSYWAGCGPHGIIELAFCPYWVNNHCSADGGSAGNTLIWGVVMSGPGYRWAGNFQRGLYAANVWLNDPGAPTIGTPTHLDGTPRPSGQTVTDGGGVGVFHVNDNGTGLKKVVINTDAGQELARAEWDNGNDKFCTGTGRTQQCPEGWHPGINLTQLPNGTSAIRVHAWDKLNNYSVYTWQITKNHYPTSVQYGNLGGTPNSIDTEQEIDAFEVALTDPTTESTLMAGLSPVDLAWVDPRLGVEDPLDPMEDISSWSGTTSWSEESVPDGGTFFGPKVNSGSFRTVAQRPHEGRDPPVPLTISAKGCWKRTKTFTGSPATMADVTVWLMQHWNGQWQEVGKKKERVISGCGSNSSSPNVPNKTVILKKLCTRYTGRNYTYLTVVDVDIVGRWDTDDIKLSGNSERTNCSVLGEAP